MSKVCDDCWGRGAVELDENKVAVCPTCNGTGK